MPAEGNQPAQLRTLLCHRDLDLAIHCLSSSMQLSADPVHLVAHEDGSLTTEDREKIRSRLPGARIIDRREADAIMSEKLAGHPNARSFREDSVWGLKLLDIVLAEPGLCFYLDGDIRFFRPFRGLFADGAARGRCVFLRDTVWQAYSVRPWHLMDARGLKIASGINTGLTLCDPAVFDLDFVDWFLGQPDWRVIPAWTEPTCWAALAMRGNGHAVIPEQLTNLYPSARITDRTLGGHFLSAYRCLWQEHLKAPLHPNEASREVQFQVLGRLSALGLALNQCKRKLQNTVLRNHWKP